MSCQLRARALLTLSCVELHELDPQERAQLPAACVASGQVTPSHVPCCLQKGSSVTPIFLRLPSVPGERRLPSLGGRRWRRARSRRGSTATPPGSPASAPLQEQPSAASPRGALPGCRSEAALRGAGSPPWAGVGAGGCWAARLAARLLGAPPRFRFGKVGGLG